MRLHKLKCCLYRSKEIENTAKRRSDALKLLDHIRQLSGKESIEEIFDWLATRERDWLSTVNKLNKQLEFSQRKKSRFQAGLILAVDQLDLFVGQSE